MMIRFQFERKEEIKYISHLDVLRLFERAFKRSGIDVEHTNGFNPRPQLVFALPMGLGLTSEGEFADVKIISEILPQEFIKRLNDATPPGIKIVSATIKTSGNNVMSIIDGAKYLIKTNKLDLAIHEKIKEFLDTQEVYVNKKTKSGEKSINIRQFVYEVNFASDEFEVLLSAGQKNNIRPELFIEGFKNYTKLNIEILSVHRLMLYAKSEDKWIRPDEL